MNHRVRQRAVDVGKKKEQFRVRELNPGHLRDRQIY